MPAGTEQHSAEERADIRRGRLRAAVVLGVLLVPVVLFALMRFSKQHYKTLPILGERKLAGTDTLYHALPAFNLVNQDGKPWAADSLRGRMHVADFFFTRCPGVCKELSKGMAEVQKEVQYGYDKARDIRLVSYSIDPRRDSTAALRDYAARYNAKPGLWTFVTGERKQIFELLEKGYLVPVADEVKGGEDGFFHSNFFVLVDPDLRIRGVYDALQQSERKRLLDEIKVLRIEYIEKGAFKTR
jgi:protein SCO1/2